MSEETIELLIRHALEYADVFLTFAFQGGEPLLARIGFFRKTVECVDSVIAILLWRETAAFIRVTFIVWTNTG